MTTTIHSFSCKHEQIRVTDNLLELDRTYKLSTPMFEAIIVLKKVETLAKHFRLTVFVQEFLRGSYFKDNFDVITTENKALQKWNLKNV